MRKFNPKLYQYRPKNSAEKENYFPVSDFQDHLYQSKRFYDAGKEFKLYKSRLPQINKDCHHRSTACLLSCVNWVLDVEECPISDSSAHEYEQGNMMDPYRTRKIMTLVSMNYDP